MPAARYQYYSISYDMWQGPPPTLPREQLVLSTRPGVDGVAAQLAGEWVQPFDVVATAFHLNYDDAHAQELLQTILIGQAWGLIWEGVNYTSEYSLLYRLCDVEVLQIKRILRFVSDTRNLVYPVQIVSRLSLLPVKVVS